MLKQLQSNFQKNIFNREQTAIIPHIRHNHISPELRLNIYRGTILQNLCHALELTFPAVWQLVGKQCADNLALAFVQEESNLPESNCLDDWGNNFPIFLQNFQPITHLTYLKDIAEIEWLKHLSYCATDFCPMDSKKFQDYFAKHSEELKITFNPSVFLHSSSYALKDIFSLMENPDAYDTINLQSTSSYVVIARVWGKVELNWIEKDLFDFMQYIQKGLPLIQAYENITQSNPDFNLIIALQFILHSCLIPAKAGIKAKKKEVY